MVGANAVGGVTRGVGTVLRTVTDSLGPARTYLVLLSAALIAVGAVLATLFNGRLVDAYAIIEESLVIALGLGVVPVGLWVVSLITALVIRYRWLLSVRIWMATLVLVAASVVGMSAFETRFGSPLEAFTRGGEISLGGNLAHYVTDGTAWLSVIITVALVILASFVAVPHLTLSTAFRGGRIGSKTAVWLFLVAGVMVKPFAATVAGIYGLATRRSAERQYGDRSRSLIPAEEMTAYIRDHTPFGTGGPVEVSDMPDRILAPDTAIVDQGNVMPEGLFDKPSIEDRDGEDRTSGVAEDMRSANKPISGAKTNRFWNKSDSEITESVQQIEATYTQPIEAKPSDASAIGPILDKWTSAWTLPGVSLLLDMPVEGISQVEMDETSKKIQHTLNDYGVEVEVKMTQPGPAVTLYGLEPGWIRRAKQENATDTQGQPLLNDTGKQIKRRVETKTRVKVDTILQREKDLALALRTPSIRMQSPVAGTSLVGIEVPNANPELVTLRSVMESREFVDLRTHGALPVALGKGSGGETVVLDLADMPHLLVAGATGSGKSVCLNTIVSCLTIEKSPSELRLLLIDPKRVELTPFNGIPHLLTPVVVDTDRVVALLKGLIGEMFKRYRHLESVGVRNISAYNNKSDEQMPYLVLVVDELADLMMTSSFDVEQSLCRLAQLGRATGIHLIVATQRPSVDVLTGLIKANFPSRVAFGVTSQVDSRTILDAGGADKLLGKGDMLYQPLDATRPSRVQGVFISDDELSALVRHWQKTAWAPLPAVGLEVPEEGGSRDQASKTAKAGDDLMDMALALARKQRKLSTSLLQRRLRIGYPRAARLMDELEEQGVVGPSDGSKSRDVIID